MRTLTPLLAGLALAACADAHRETKAPAIPPSAADISATSPMTVNPEPAGARALAPAAKPDDKAMPPGAVNPKP